MVVIGFYIVMALFSKGFSAPNLDGFAMGSSPILPSPDLGDPYDTAEEVAEDIDSLACINENKTYTIDIKLHSDTGVIEALHSTAKAQLVDSIGESVSEVEAVAAYYGTVIDEMNAELIKYKLQLHLNLDSYNTDAFMGNVVADKSCEIRSPIPERNSNAFEYLKKSFETNMGVHLFVWSCVFVPSNAELHEVLSNFKCGRVIGVLWSGTLQTRNIIKFAILKAITNAEQEYSANMKFDDMIIGPQLCKYVTGCVGLDKNELGQLISGTEVVKYTDMFANEEENIINNQKGLVHVH